jgi:DNA-binding NtrC family response regulator
MTVVSARRALGTTFDAGIAQDDLVLEQRKLLYVKPAHLPNILVPELSAAGWNVYIVRDLKKARELVEEYDFRVGLAYCDACLDAHTHEYMQELYLANANTYWVALLPREAVQDKNVRELVTGCFYDFHTLPPDLDRLLVTLGRAYGMAELHHRFYREQDGKLSEYEIVGKSPVMQTLFRDIRKVSGVDAPVLITGESGTGKELTALAIHAQSKRRNAPFIAVNCGALPANLIQSELFGHEKGAFTGAHQRKIGRIESAEGGTIFLDEIGDLSLDLQVNLLRFLQEKTIERVGGTQSVQVDVRVIAATHVDLEQAVAEGRFREDLYYRLNVLHLRVPSLRERENDIEILAQFFFNKFSKEKSPQVRGFSQQALRLMNTYDWPGNVRELINRIRRAMVMCETRLITPTDLGLERRSSRRSIMSLDDARGAAEKEAILYALQRAGNNISQAARELRISRVTLYRLMEKYSITL